MHEMNCLLSDKPLPAAELKSVDMIDSKAKYRIHDVQHMTDNCQKKTPGITKYLKSSSKGVIISFVACWRTSSTIASVNELSSSGWLVAAMTLTTFGTCLSKGDHCNSCANTLAGVNSVTLANNISDWNSGD